MLRTLPAKTQNIILVCAKCSRKVEGGFGKKGNKSLANELRALGDGKKGRKSNLLVIETGCMKLCPKGKVVAVNTAQPAEWLLVSPCADVKTVASKLGVPQDVA